MLVRSSALEKGMSQYLVDQIFGTENIEVLTRTEVAEVHGEHQLESITIVNKDTDETQTLPAAALFIFIGAVPHTELVAGVVERNRAGFIITGPDLIHEGRRPKGWTLKRDPYFLETSVPGIFAPGDVRQGAVRRVASAVGQGAIAISLLHQYLKAV
jgi:thioredoxin reductase (NADPH)